MRMILIIINDCTVVDNKCMSKLIKKTMRFGYTHYYSIMNFYIVKN